MSSVSMPAMGICGVEQFGGLAAVRKKYEELKADGAKREEKLMAEIERTGLIENGKGEMVELSSLTDIERRNLTERALGKLYTREEMIIGLLATAPNSDEVEANKARAALLAPIQNKMMRGVPLTAAEKRLLKEDDNGTGWAAISDRIDEEVARFKSRLRGCKSQQQSKSLYLSTKMSLMSSISEKDGSALFIIAAIDRAYKRYGNRAAQAYNAKGEDMTDKFEELMQRGNEKLSLNRIQKDYES